MINTQCYDLPSPPNYTYGVFRVGKAIVACSPTCYRNQTLLDPAEEAEIGRLFIYLGSKQKWVEVNLDNHPAKEQIEQDILMAYDKVMAEEEDSYLDRQELY